MVFKTCPTEAVQKTSITFLTTLTLGFVAFISLQHPFQQIFAQTPVTGTVTKQITAKEDDAEESLKDGGVNLSSVDLELLHDDDSADQTVGMRFQNVTIPKNAVIESAVLTFTADDGDSKTTNITFYAENTDNATVFVSKKHNITSRVKTTAKVDWNNVGSWKDGSTYQTPDLSKVVQEVVKRSGWQSGNSLVLFATGTGQRVAVSYNGSSTKAPKLIIRYRTDGVSPSLTPTNTPVPTVTITPTSTPTNTPTPLPTGFTPTVTPTLTPTIIPTATLVPTGSPTATPTPTNTPSVPAQILDLSNWKITLPIGTAEKPTEILQPQLGSYQLDPWFIVQNGAVRLRAAVNAPTTSGSNYPRSELREMKNNGKDMASWSATSGTHTMIIDQAITAVPVTKRHVVAGQIHDSSDDIIVIRLEDKNLYVNVDGSNKYTLTNNYVLGTRFTVKFEVSGGVTNVYYNGTRVYTLNKSYSGAYFKAGAYTQSNCSKEAANVCTADNYGEVVIYSLSVTHQ